MLIATWGSVTGVGLVAVAEGGDGEVLEVGEFGCTAEDDEGELLAGERDGDIAGAAVGEPRPMVPTPAEVTARATTLDDDDDGVAEVGPLGEGKELMGPAPLDAAFCASARALARASAATSPMRSAVRKRSMVGTSKCRICPQAKVQPSQVSFCTL
jgi:hypothetical protein